MKARLILTAAGLLLAMSSATFGATPTSGYVDVNGLHMYYEIRGRGEPLLLLHGGVDPDQWGPNLDALAKTHRVITVHLQGHGHTKDIDRPFRFEQLADDVAAFAAKMNLSKVDLLGHSFGGNIALQVAIRHPTLVRRLVIVSAVMKRDGWYPEVVQGFEAMAKDPKKLADPMSKSPLGTRYRDVNWVALFKKMGDLQASDYDWSKDVAALPMPVLLVFADADAVRADHIVEMWKAVGGGARDAGPDGSQRPAKARLAIIPGATHYALMKTTAVAQTVEPFLATPK